MATNRILVESNMHPEDSKRILIGIYFNSDRADILFTEDLTKYRNRVQKELDNTFANKPVTLDELWYLSHLTEQRVGTTMCYLDVEIDLSKLEIPTEDLSYATNNELDKLRLLVYHYIGLLTAANEIALVDSAHHQTKANKKYVTREHLVDMLEQIRDRSVSEMPLTKKHRWLGYVQSVLIHTHGLTDVDSERDFTRPIFNGS